MYLVASVRPSVCPSVRLGVLRAHYTPQVGWVRMSVRPSVRPSVSTLTAEPFDLWPFWRVAVDIRGSLCRVRQRAKRSHYQSKVFVCVPNSRADAVDRLLILIGEEPWDVFPFFLFFSSSSFILFFFFSYSATDRILFPVTILIIPDVLVTYLITKLCM